VSALSGGGAGAAAAGGGVAAVRAKLAALKAQLLARAESADPARRAAVEAKIQKLELLIDEVQEKQVS